MERYEKENNPKNVHRNKVVPFYRQLELLTYKHLFRAGVFVNKDEIQLRVAFNQVDTDNSGSIDVEELSNAMRALGRDLPREQIRAMMDAVDTDKSGEIDFDEFKEMMENVKNAHKLNDDRLDFRKNGNHQAT